MKKKFKSKFKDELRKQGRLAVAAAIGFLIAFSWRDTILTATQDYVQRFTTIQGVLQLKFAASIVATVIGVLLILVSSELLKN